MTNRVVLKSDCKHAVVLPLNIIPLQAHTTSRLIPRRVEPSRREMWEGAQTRLQAAQKGYLPATDCDRDDGVVMVIVMVMVVMLFGDAMVYDKNVASETTTIAPK